MSKALRELAGFEAPFIIGQFLEPHNPAPFPDVLPMRIGVDPQTGLVRQMFDPEVERHLVLAYERGSLLGTPMDDSAAGSAYARDFLSFIVETCDLAGRRVLEIGAGRGYLLRLMSEQGADAMGVEPGREHASYWAHYGVKVVNRFFPAPEIEGLFDAIVAYGVLEHIERLAVFLHDIRCRLAPGGRVILAVPDCGGYIEDGDPGMLAHEHWNYFSAATLRRTLEAAGLRIAALQPAGVGGVLYVAADVDTDPPAQAPEADVRMAELFEQRRRRLRTEIGRRLDALEGEGRSLGIFMAGRALMWMEPGRAVRFFDDDPALKGRFYPPFPHAIENRQDLLARPVDELWIMSRSFGARVAEELRQAGLTCPMLGIDQLLPLESL